MQFTQHGYEFAQRIVKRNKNLQDRIFDLVKNGYTIGTRYTLKKSGHLSPCQIEYVKLKKEHRMVVGYRPFHQSREAICVIWKE